MPPFPFMEHQVVFIHGAHSTRNSFNFLQTMVPAGKCLYFEYDINTEHIDDIQDELDAFIGTKSVHLIGHSMGGVLAAAATKCCPNVQSVTTISAPIQGVELPAYVLFFKPFSKFLQNLDNNRYTFSRARRIASVPTLTIQTTGGNHPLLPEPNDGVVTLSSQLLPSATVSMIVDLNHFEVLMDTHVQQTIDQFIGDVERGEHK